MGRRGAPPPPHARTLTLPRDTLTETKHTHTHPYTRQLVRPEAKGDRGGGAGGAADDEEDEEEAKKGWKFGRNEGSMSWGWKLCCAILYMLPWVDVTEKTVYFIERFPAFHWAEYFTGLLRLRCWFSCVRASFDDDAFV